MMRITGWCVLAMLAVAARGQEFEVASVKPNKSGSGGSSTHTDQGRLQAENVSLRQMVVMAYGMRDYQVEAPEWLSDVRFDVSAKFPEALGKDPVKYRAAFQSMMQKMLADRFKLASHRSEKTFSVYGLVVSKGGIKLKEVPDTGSHNSNSNDLKYTGTCVNMEGFATFLSRRMDMPVLDMTGLKGYYDIKLEWAPEPKPRTDGKLEVSNDPTGPTLPMVLQDQLGLKLEGRKAPIEIVVVDRCERAPTEN